MFILAVILTATTAPSTGVAGDTWTYVLLLLLGCVLLAAAAVGRHRNDGLLLLLVVSALLLYGQSTLLLLVESESVAEFRRFRQPDVDEVNLALLLAVASVIALAAGLWAGRSRSVDAEAELAVRRVLPTPFFRGRRFYLVVGVAGLLLALALTALLSIRASGVRGGPFSWVANLVDRDFFALLLVTLLVYAGPRMRSWERQVTLTVLALYVGVALSQGSRGGLLVLIVAWAIVRVAREGDFRLSRRQLVALAGGIILTGAVIWPVATGIRLARIANLPLNISTVTRMIEIAQELRGEDRHPALELIYPILHRQGRMPQAVALANDWVPTAADRIPLRGLGLNAAGRLLPRVSVDQNKYPSLGRAYPIFFLGMPPDRIHGAEWSPMALVILFAPPWLAVCIWFLWGFFTQKAYSALSRVRGGYGLVVRAAFLYLLVFQAFSSATVDDLVPRFVRWVVLAALVMGTYTVLVTVSNRDGHHRVVGGHR